MRLVPVPPAKTMRAWPFVERWIEAALRRGNADQTPDDVRRQLDRGGMQMWLVWGGGRPHGVVITELLESARGRTCNIVVAAGEEFRTWGHLEADLERWAAEQWGCVRLTLVGRKGWMRRLNGWRETAVTLERRIDDG